MNQAVFDFLCNYLSTISIPYYITDASDTTMADLDLGLRNSILKNKTTETTSSLESFQPQALYHFSDFYSCHYSFFRLPDDRFFFIGPYLLNDIREPEIRQLMTAVGIPDSLFLQLQNYYYELILIKDRPLFLNFLKQSFCTICDCSQPNIISFDLQTLESREAYLKKHTFVVPKDPVLAMKILEKRYHSEDVLLHAVSKGNTAAALDLTASLGSIRFSSRSNDFFRDAKNTLLSFNTLLRRTAYNAGVHPFYIDVVSDNYARLIENAASQQELEDIPSYMVRSYCDLVKKRSLSLYSEPIRQILVTIDASIAGDLSLKRFAKELFLNTSYLSSLFKKETGMTLTDYVNKNRINTAKRLLKSTTLSIQDVAATVGIPDIHYFTRLFRRETGCSPREFRKK